MGGCKLLSAKHASSFACQGIWVQTHRKILRFECVEVESESIFSGICVLE